jgi:DNA-binding XRE family transcriptional regulator
MGTVWTYFIKSYILDHITAIRLYIWSLNMRSSVSDVLPSSVKRSLTKFGSDLATARRKRGLTILAVAERMGVAKNTYLRAEKGDPAVGLGVYAMALFVLGFGSPLGTLIDVSRDDTGLLLDEERLPKRVRMKKALVPQS